MTRKTTDPQETTTDTFVALQETQLWFSSARPDSIRGLFVRGPDQKILISQDLAESFVRCALSLVRIQEPVIVLSKNFWWFLNARSLPPSRRVVIAFRVWPYYLGPDMKIDPVAAILSCAEMLKQLLVLSEEAYASMTIPGSGVAVIVALTNLESSDWVPAPSRPELTLDVLRTRIKEAVEQSGLSYKAIGIKMGFDPKKNPKAKVWRLLHQTNDPGLFTLNSFCNALELPLTKLLFTS